MKPGLSWVPGIWAVLLAALLLGPALGYGYVHTYDMVWFPDLAVRPDFLGLGTATPRAVPSDAVVAVLDEVVPGMLLQKLVLLGSLVAAGVGAARLAASLPVVAQCAAVTVTVWNPYVVERLWIGHWPMLLAYGVLPWLVMAAARARGMGIGPLLMLLLLVGSLSASAGIASAIVVLVFGWGERWRTNLCLLGLVAAVNAPWIGSGLVSAGAGTSAAAGAEVFASAAEGRLPAPLAVLTLGGIWNIDTVPSSRQGVLGLFGAVLLLALLAVGVVRWWRGAEDRSRFVVCWAAGTGVALGSWAVPEAIGWLSEVLPGFGVFRDGSRLLLLGVPLVAVLVSHGVAALLRLRPAEVGVVLAGAAVLWPVAVMPDAAWGVSGNVTAVAEPESHRVLRASLAGRSGDVVFLPFSAYRAPAWNDGRTVINPLPRVPALDHVVDDTLWVGERAIAGEDPRAREVAAALALDDAQERTAGLAQAGITFVVIEAELLSGAAELVRGTVVLDDEGLLVIELAAAAASPSPGPLQAGVVVGSWCLWLGCVAGAASGGVRRLTTRRHS